MTVPTHLKEKQEAIVELDFIRSSLLVTSWTMETMSRGNNPPEGKRGSEFYEGVSFILDLLALRMSEVYRTLNPE